MSPKWDLGGYGGGLKIFKWKDPLIDTSCERHHYNQEQNRHITCLITSISMAVQIVNNESCPPLETAEENVRRLTSRFIPLPYPECDPTDQSKHTSCPSCRVSVGSRCDGSKKSKTENHPKRQNLPKLHTENENEEPPKCIRNGQKLNKLTILHQNIRGLTKKVNRLNHILSERSPSLLILTEHGLSQGELENTNITGYSLITEYSRTNHRLGGVAVYSAESLMSTVEVVDVSQHSLELVCEVAMI
ncbi:hypothetical protein J6590_059584 [Homalodisca vitripennis]|nr:hypothetical protein J6590_059584 [Homalodisca vitripennis]